MISRDLCRTLHPVPDAAPPKLIQVPDLIVTKDDVELCARLLARYRRALSCDSAQGAARGTVGIWDTIRDTVQSDYLQVLNEDDPGALADYLAGMYRYTATHGTCQGAWEHGLLSSNIAFRAQRSWEYKDKIVSLAAALGVRNVENPEQGAWGEALRADLDALVLSINDHLGFSIAPPPIDGGLFKLETSHGLFHERDLHSLHAVLTMRRHFGSDISVCEIGGGVGKAAYWASRVLSRGAGGYTIIDLPHIGVLQGYALEKAGVSTVDPAERKDGKDAFVLLTYPQVIDEVVIARDVIFNQDSLPEIPAAEACAYLRWMKNNRHAVQHFYSINQESAAFGPGSPQNIVRDLVRETTRFERIFRERSWLRAGYVDEIYCL